MQPGNPFSTESGSCGMLAAMMFAALKRWFAPDAHRQAVHKLYVALVAQARQPVFYRDWHVPDTLDGRFDVIVLHLFLAIARLEREGDSTAGFIRALSEAFFADMDRNLREMGVGDTGVGLRVKNMAQAFYGRLKAYGESLSDMAALSEALKRNVWREQPVEDAKVAALADYMQRHAAQLQTQLAEAIMRGEIAFS